MYGSIPYLSLMTLLISSLVYFGTLPSLIRFTFSVTISILILETSSITSSTDRDRQASNLARYSSSNFLAAANFLTVASSVTSPRLMALSVAARKASSVSEISKPKSSFQFTTEISCSVVLTGRKDSKYCSACLRSFC